MSPLFSRSNAPPSSFITEDLTIEQIMGGNKLIRGFRVYLVIALLALATAAGALAANSVTPKPGRYDPKCPQGYQSICGEGVFIVLPGSRKIEKFAVVPWPNNPSNPSRGICGRDNPFIESRIGINGGKFAYSGTASGKKLTWTGKWVSRRKVTGTVKWAGCSTLVKYTAQLTPTP